MTRVSVDIDLDDVIDEISDRDLIEELQDRYRRGRITPALISGARQFTAPDDGGRALRLLADQIACGETADALDTLASMFPAAPVHDAIGYARRSGTLRLSS